jgi:hypothetical protein
MNRDIRTHRLAAICLAAFAVSTAPAAAQSQGIWGRVSFTAQNASTKDSGVSRSFNELITTITVSSPPAESGGSEFAFDFRGATYPSVESRDNRVSVYEAYFGQRFAGGRMGVRVGQMWLNDLGALGSVGGFLAEYRQPKRKAGLRVRAGAFGGLEPKILEAGYTTDVRKYGAYVALDGQGAQRHVVGYVSLRNQDLTERSVVTFSNFVPVGSKFFLYQAAEYDLSGPGGQGSGGMNYFFANARYSPARLVEVQGSYHRGRSIDARTITTDMINGRPISSRSLEGLLYETAGGRVWLNLPQRFRVFGGYFRDRNNREDRATDRVSFGFFNPNLFGTGFDLGVTDSRNHLPNSSYDSWDVSIGRSVTSRAYLSGGYTSSLSVFRLVGTAGFVVENRPRTTRYFGSGMFYLTRRLALLVNGEHLADGTLTEMRWLSSISMRF